jgi:hypothetical protein
LDLLEWPVRHVDLLVSHHYEQNENQPLARTANIVDNREA